MPNPQKPNTQRPDFSAEKDALQKKFSRIPSDLDVLWSLLNKDRLMHAKSGEWGLYRNDTLEMADALMWTHRDASGLSHYLEVCYLDLNDPSNNGLFDDPELLAEFPPFRFDPNGLAPDVVELTAQSIKLSGQNIEQVEANFLSRSATIHKSLHLPLEPKKAWRIISAELKKHLQAST
jgi:hypothetical protein